MGLCRAAIVLALCLLLVAPGSAVAGTYEVSLCSTTSGSGLGTDGWAPFFVLGSGTITDQCSHGGLRGLESTLAANTTIANGNYVGWSFSAAPGTTITNYALWRSVRPNQGSNSTGGNFWAHAYVLNEDVRVPLIAAGSATVEACVPNLGTGCPAPGNPAAPYSNANRFSRSQVELRRLIATMECFADYSCPPVATPGQLRIHAARIGLSDPHAPSFTSVPTGPSSAPPPRWTGNTRSAFPRAT